MARKFPVLQHQTFKTGTKTLDAIRERGEAGPGAYDGWEIVNWADPLPDCAKANCRKYAKLPAKRPTFHMGCDCELHPGFKDE